MAVDRDDRVPARGLQPSVSHATSAIASGETLPRDAGLRIGHADGGAALLRVQPIAELADRQRLRPEISLSSRTPERDEEARLPRGFDPFGHDIEAEVVGERDDAADDRRVARIARAFGDEGP